MEHIMSKHSLQLCIDLAESIPQDRGNYGVVRELLVELHHLAKLEEAGPRITTRPLNLPA